MDRGGHGGNIHRRNSRVPIPVLEEYQDNPVSSEHRPCQLTARPGQLLQHIQLDPFLCHKSKLPIGALPTKHSIQERTDLVSSLDGLLNFPACGLELILEVWETVYELLERDPLRNWRSVRYADSEDVCDEIGVPKSDTVYCCTSPGFKFRIYME